MNVPFVDLKAQYASIKPEVGPAMNEVLEACSFIMGPQVTSFEDEFARYNGTRYCVGVESGTAALKLALEAIDVGPGDEVILPANTYIASAIAVSAVGATPVFVDHDDYYLIDATAIEAAITPRTKAIIPVHLYGQMVPMQPIIDIAKRHGLRVVEDAAQSHGARWQGHRAGSVGDVGCFSFYPGKNLGCYGDGGAIVTNDEAIAERVRLLRDFGQKRKYEHEIKGDNCRLDSIQAAVLSVKLRHIDAWNARRLENAKEYDRLLGAAGFDVPKRLTDEGHVYHLYVVEVDDRAAVMQRLGERGVQSGIHYPIPIHLQKAYADLDVPRGSFPRTERNADRILSLPMFAEMTKEQIAFVVESLAAVARPAAPAVHA
ncbi:MAG TPA: DegT/DnrJ/EryC1/StrS family aminotransferase [Candidatus Tumulicola sp.]|jgi:dTDP-4-amino-4,6-dideoxygalactose transaminase